MATLIFGRGQRRLHHSGRIMALTTARGASAQVISPRAAPSAVTRLCPCATNNPHYLRFLGPFPTLSSSHERYFLEPPVIGQCDKLRYVITMKTFHFALQFNEALSRRFHHHQVFPRSLKLPFPGIERLDWLNIMFTHAARRFSTTARAILRARRNRRASDEHDPLFLASALFIGPT